MDAGEPHNRALEGALELRRATAGRRDRIRGRGTDLMTLRFAERYVMALNLLLIAILAYFLALSVNGIVLGRVTSASPAHLPSLLGAEPSAAITRPRGFYDGISR